MQIIRVMDVETTGKDPADSAVCEIGWADVMVDGTARVERGACRVINPQRPIPPEVSAVHHIIDEDVAGAPLLHDVMRIMADAVLADHRVVALAAHQAKFEQAFLGSMINLPWICTYKAAMRVWPDAPSHSNGALMYWRKPVGLDRGLAQPAHRAGPDAYVTAFHLRDLLNDGIPLGDLLAWTNEPVLLRKFRFGKHADKPISEIPADYFEWMLRQDFGEDEMHTAKTELERRRAAPRVAVPPKNVAPPINAPLFPL